MKMNLDEIKNLLQSEKPGWNVVLHKPGKRGKFNDECYTPSQLTTPLLETMEGGFGYFDLDPASSDASNGMNKIAKRYLTEKEDGIVTPWRNSDYVFCNPPYTWDLMVPFCKKMVMHNNGILLVLDKTTVITRKLLDANCTCVLRFGSYRPWFIDPCGNKNFQHVVSLYAFGEKAMKHLIRAKKVYEDNGLDPILAFGEHIIASLLD
jgi:hypothetical protein